MLQHKVYIGMDISKDNIDFYNPGSINTKHSRCIRSKSSLIKHLAKHKLQDVDMHFILEATGNYSKEVHSWLGEAKSICSIINPRNIRYFGKAKGILAKTDEIDAKLISEYGYAINPAPTMHYGDDSIKLKAYRARRDQLLSIIQQESNHLRDSKDKVVRKQIQEIIDKLKKQVEFVEEYTATIISNNQEMQESYDIITSVPGVGKISAVTLLSELPELGKVGRTQIAAIVGLAPFNRDSGNFRGKRSIFGGRKTIRNTLYMAALVAIKHNKFFSKKFESLNQDKPFKVAIVAIMRKIIVLLNSMLKSKKAWNLNMITY